MKSILKLPLAGCLRIAANVCGFVQAGISLGFALGWQIDEAGIY